MSVESKIVIGVPGKWADRTAIVNSIASDSDGYLFVGSLMSHVESKEVCTLEIYDRDPELMQAYTLAGCGKISEEDLAAIDDHSHTLYVSGPRQFQRGGAKTDELCQRVAFLRWHRCQSRIDRPGPLGGSMAFIDG